MILMSLVSWHCWAGLDQVVEAQVLWSLVHDDLDSVHCSCIFGASRH
jgi:hypothetical protein